MIPETNSKSCSGSTPSPKPSQIQGIQASAGKIMCTVFWNAEGKLLIDYMPHKSDSYRVTLLCWLTSQTACRRGKLIQVPLLLHDSASAHRSHVGQATVLECAFEEMCHLPFSCVSKFKETPPWTEIFDRRLAQVCEKEWLKGQSELFYFTGIKKLQLSLL